jgi:tellurite resistance protein
VIDLVQLAKPSAPAPRKQPLKHLFPGWFGIVMGWSGLALAWHRATELMGPAAGTISLLAGGVATSLFVILLLASAWRVQRHGQAWLEDLHHPVRHAFVAAMPISLLLLVIFGVATLGPAAPGLAALWALASLLQFGVTVWVLARWLRASPASGGPAWQWAGITPALFIPIVGNVLVPLAGLPLGYAGWSAAQFGLGLLFWPVVMVLFFVRLGQAGPLPERMLPTVFIHVAPPAVIGTALLQFGAPVLWGWALWGMALFMALWSLTLTRRVLALPFGIPHWAMSFPLAALAALSLRLAATPDGTWLQTPAVALLAAVSLLMLWLSLSTVRGLRAGSLLVPEGPPPAAAPPARSAIESATS